MNITVNLTDILDSLDKVSYYHPIHSKALKAEDKITKEKRKPYVRLYCLNLIHGGKGKSDQFYLTSHTLVKGLAQ